MIHQLPTCRLGFQVRYRHHQQKHWHPPLILDFCPILTSLRLTCPVLYNHSTVAPRGEQIPNIKASNLKRVSLVPQNQKLCSISPYQRNKSFPTSTTPEDTPPGSTLLTMNKMFSYLTILHTIVVTWN